MATQLIMTVGTNALPVWVAWHHLKDKLDPPIKVRFIHTADTTDDKDRLVKYCQGSNFGNHIKTSPGDPATVRRDIRQKILNGLDENTTTIHFHYTGGTKVMGVEAESAIESKLPQNIQMETSYLDPRSTGGPSIAGRSRRYVDDARKNVNPQLDRIALLNGFIVPPFGHHPFLQPPTPNQLRYGRKFLNKPDMVVPKGVAGIKNKGDLLEYGAYDALEAALKSITTRTNYIIFQGVHCRRKGVPSAKKFELDVVAALGYQLIVISCDTSSPVPKNDTASEKQKKRKLGSFSINIKRKAIEAYHRAKQLGGDEAWAIMLCKAEHNIAAGIQEELRDETGSKSMPLQVWGEDKWPNLQNQFVYYLRNDLHWR
ncbi:hypothetical protein F4055_04035 [Candidatus Poribacteria bacterium]|nr:hypothetical protein [Candidatus Poribacteria bacterium]